MPDEATYCATMRTTLRARTGNGRLRSDGIGLIASNLGYNVDG